MDIYGCITGKDYAAIEKEFDGKGYGDFKLAVAEAINSVLGPIHMEYERIIKDKSYLDGIIKENDSQAMYFANKTLRKARKKIGFTDIPRKE